MTNVFRDVVFLPVATILVWSNYANQHWSPSDFPHIYGSLFAYYAIDLCFSKLRPDCVIHHCMALYFVVQDWVVPYDAAFRTACVNVEIPSIVLTLLPYVWKPIQAPANLLFGCLFIKTRILDIYPFLTLQATLFNCVLWGFYVLNLYWCGIILRKGAKPFIGGKKLDHVAHFLCSLTFASSFVFQAAIETPLQKAAHLALAVTSFNVHWFYNKRICIWWVADIVSMHLVCIYLTPVYSRISYAMHAGVVAIRIYFVKDYTRPLSLLPFVLDGVVTMQNFCEKTQISIIVSALCTVLVEKISPFYDLSFVAVHGLLIWCMHIYLVSHSNPTNY
jgi:hypothetical protein